MIIERRFIKLLLIVFCSVSGFVKSEESQSNWPKLREFNLSVGVDLSADRIALDVPIYGEDGIPYYELNCRGGDPDSFILPLFGNGYFYWPLTCDLRLIVDKIGTGRLLSESFDPILSRGVIVPEDFKGSCLNYPEYGKNRNFRLRGFQLTLNFRDIQWGEAYSKLLGKMDSTIVLMMMDVSLINDSTALTPLPEPTGYIDPKGKSCDVVLKGGEKYQCRNYSTWSYEDCGVEEIYRRVLEGEKERLKN